MTPKPGTDGRCRMGSYWDDITGALWAECGKGHQLETFSMPILEAWVRVHDCCRKSPSSSSVLGVGGLGSE